ncbi:MAG TPA: hypothetical protein ENN08_03630 [Bacteroidales bacterium]|nr:hypothetical protein [Bacteroidales bacterium]
MKKYLFRAILLLLLTCLGTATVHAQGRLIRKIQEKAEDKVIEEIFKDEDKDSETETSPDTQIDPDGREYESSREMGPNRRGGGLTQTPPDVYKNITEAETSFNAAKYAEAKSAVRQALWGVELEIGQNILKSLPESVEGMKYAAGQDRVTSSGIGFVGLVIQRVYEGKSDMELRTSIGNDAALLGLAGMYMAGGMYMHSTDDADQKSIRFQGHNATIRYDDYDGYTLGVPFGQSSMLVLNGKNFDSENDFMAAANNFDVEKIKKELGEQ